MFNHQKLKCYAMSLDVAKSMPALMATRPRGSYYLEDQLKRALSSAILNTVKGNSRRSKAERARFCDIARASDDGSASCIDVAHALKMVDDDRYQWIQDRLLQIVKMLSNLR